MEEASRRGLGSHVRSGLAHFKWRRTVEGPHPIEEHLEDMLDEEIKKGFGMIFRRRGLTHKANSSNWKRLRRSGYTCPKK